MEDEKLVSMANQISRFFHAYPDEDAIKGIHDHIVAFWTPGMRRTLNDRIAADPAGIDTLVVQAIAPGAKPPGQNPTRKEAAGPGTLGELDSDAG